MVGCAAPTPRGTDVDRSPTQTEDGAPAGQEIEQAAASCASSERSSSQWYDRAVGYEIFVRSFRDSDGDGVGDLAGLTASLDYLNDGDPETSTDLGVTLLWLMPITESPSYHGYDVTDYGRIDPAYGTDADLDGLLAAAESRGIHVILDLVLNHTSSQHPWFLDAVASTSSQYRGFYVWADEDLGWTRPWGGGPTWHPTPTGHYYGLFWDGMPDLNFGSPTVQATLIEVATGWLDRGIAGFRLDAVRYLVETGPDDGQ
ncbi:MAG: alpha-amylase family glycosyl hydrolase, partial [Myxococcota bacterium]|nr:alpha-amylase family glycosyl hydrolase [Myxococcota bacterium]